jgi:hypothetical protein
MDFILKDSNGLEMSSTIVEYHPRTHVMNIKSVVFVDNYTQKLMKLVREEDDGEETQYFINAFMSDFAKIQELETIKDMDGYPFTPIQGTELIHVMGIVDAICTRMERAYDLEYEICNTD